MTNETKAPERIYMDGDIEVGDGYWTRCFEHPKQCSEPAIEYIRADLSDAKEARIAELEAKLAKAVDGLHNIIGMLDDPTGHEHVRDMRGATLIARATIAQLKGTDQ